MDFGTIVNWGIKKLTEGADYFTEGEFLEDVGEFFEGEARGVVKETAKGFLGVSDKKSGRIDPRTVKYNKSRVQASQGQAGQVRQPSLQDMGYTPRAIEYGNRALNSSNRFVQDSFNIIRPNLSLLDPNITLAQAELPTRKLSRT